MGPPTGRMTRSDKIQSLNLRDAQEGDKDAQIRKCIGDETIESLAKGFVSKVQGQVFSLAEVFHSYWSGRTHLLTLLLLQKASWRDQRRR